jgi:hypothetical protein
MHQVETVRDVTFSFQGSWSKANLEKEEKTLIVDDSKHAFEVHGRSGFVARFTNFRCAAMTCFVRGRGYWVQNKNAHWDHKECDRAIREDSQL